MLNIQEIIFRVLRVISTILFNETPELWDAFKVIYIHVGLSVPRTGAI